MNLSFKKFHGAGNDFIILNLLDDNYLLSSEQITFLCDRRLGIGADGLIMLYRSDINDFKMVYYNADGKIGSMCGNGGRSIAAFAFDEGIVGKNMQFTAYDGDHEAVIIQSDNESFEVKLTMMDVLVENFNEEYLIIDTGSPHYVTRVDNLAAFDVNNHGKKIRHSKQLSTFGVNANFMEKIDNNIYLRTYERGVEEETLSCGTGVTAAAIANSLWYGENSAEIITRGGNLKVTFNRNENHFSNIELTGPVKKVFEGTITI